MTQDRHTETVRIYDGDGQPINAGNPLPVTGGAGGTSMTDDAAFTPGSSSVTPMGAVYQATPDSVDDNDVGAPRMSANRVLMATGDVAHDAADSGNPVKVGGKYNSSKPSLADGDRSDLQVSVEGQVVVSGNDSYNADAVAGLVGLAVRGTAGQNRGLAAGMLMYNGSNFDRVRGDTTNGVDVDVTRSALPTGASTLAEQQTQTTALSAIQTAAQVMDDWDQGDRAKVNAQEVSGVMIENGVDVTVKYAAIGAASSGDNTLVAGVSGKKIRVMSMALISTGTVNIYFTSNAGGTVIWGNSTTKINLLASVGFVLPYNPHGWFQVATDGHNLIVNLSGAVGVSGGLTYIEAE